MYINSKANELYQIVGIHYARNRIAICVQDVYAGYRYLLICRVLLVLLFKYSSFTLLELTH